MKTRADARGPAPAVSAGLLLALLEALRDQDTPPDIYPDENPHPDLPQRLGMSDVILDQIRRYRRLGPRGRVPASEALDLVRLVARRTDAADVFDSAGRTVAARAFERRSLTLRLLLRLLPGRLRFRAALRHVRARAASILGTADFHVVDAPGALYAHGALGARAGAGSACRLYGAYVRETLRLFTGAPGTVRHEVCETMGDGRCVWTVEPPAA